jgi:hypothetical protein
MEHEIMRVMMISLCCFILLTACDENKDIKDTVFAPQVKALEKARGVENTIKQGAEKNREAADLPDRAGEPEQQ